MMNRQKSLDASLARPSHGGRKSLDAAFLMDDERDDYILFRTPPTPRRRLDSSPPPSPSGRPKLHGSTAKTGSAACTDRPSPRRAPKIRDINRSLSTDSPRRRERREMRRSKTQRRNEYGKKTDVSSEHTKDTILASSAETSPAKKAQPTAVNRCFQYDEYGLT